MSGRGRPRGAHRSTPASLNRSLPGSADKEHDPTLNDEGMDVNPVRSRMRVGSGVASLSAQPKNGSAPLTDWPEDGQLEDADPNEVPTVPLSQTVLETPVPFGESIQGESQIPAFARLSDFTAQTGMEGMLARAPNADPEASLPMRTRQAQPLLTPQTLLSRVLVSGIAHATGLSLTQPISRISLNPPRQAVSPLRTASTGQRMGTPPRTSTRPVPSHVTFNTPVTATAPNAQPPRPLVLNVSWIVAIAKKHEYGGPLVGEKQQEHMDRYEEYKFDVLKMIGYYPGPDAAVVASLAALQHLTGKVKQVVMKWHSKQAPGTLISMEVIFDLLLEDIRLVIPDPMDVAAEVRATTATSVAMEIQREIGQNRHVKISRVMRALNNAIEMREALDDGAGVMDSYSR
jgi:hypothetical protein